MADLSVMELDSVTLPWNFPSWLVKDENTNRFQMLIKNFWCYISSLFLFYFLEFLIPLFKIFLKF